MVLLRFTFDYFLRVRIIYRSACTQCDTHTQAGKHTERQTNTHADTVAMCSTDMHTADPVFVDLVAFEGPMYCRLTLLCITHIQTEMRTG